MSGRPKSAGSLGRPGKDQQHKDPVSSTVSTHLYQPHDLG